MSPLLLPGRAPCLPCAGPAHLTRVATRGALAGEGMLWTPGVRRRSSPPGLSGCPRESLGTGKGRKPAGSGGGAWENEAADGGGEVVGRGRGAVGRGVSGPVLHSQVSRAGLRRTPRMGQSPVTGPHPWRPEATQHPPLPSPRHPACPLCCHPGPGTAGLSRPTETGPPRSQRAILEVAGQAPEGRPCSRPPPTSSRPSLGPRGWAFGKSLPRGPPGSAGGGRDHGAVLRPLPSALSAGRGPSCLAQPRSSERGLGPLLLSEPTGTRLLCSQSWSTEGTARSPRSG